ncbi:JMJD7, partial [Symbiodinium microadriaticum]
LAGDLFAVSAIRLGTRAANYAVWSASNASARAAMGRSQHSEVLHAAKVAKSLSPLQCKKKAFDRPSLLSPGKSHPWGCPEVAPRDFATRCLRSRGDSLPCVLRGAAADLLRKDFPLDRPLEPWLATGGNETVKVSFPYEGLGGVASLNRIEASSRVLERQGANISDGSPAWTLLRPGNWHMRLADAVAFAERHPSQAIYMNQVMLPDLGAKALQMLRTPAWAKTLKLVQPSLWLTADVALTGFHTDGPENLLAQLSGSKDLTLLRPSEKSKLAYEEMIDAEPKTTLSADGIASIGQYNLHRKSSGHSALDVGAKPKDVPPELLKNYNEAEGAQCHLRAGDVLYIPAQWHHAVLTVPDESCIALSLNLWYHRIDDVEAVINQSGNWLWPCPFKAAQRRSLTVCK